MNRAPDQPHTPPLTATRLTPHDRERSENDFIRLLKVKAGIEYPCEMRSREAWVPRLAPEDLHLAERQADRRGLELEQYARELFHLAVCAEEESYRIGRKRL